MPRRAGIALALGLLAGTAALAQPEQPASLPTMTKGEAELARVLKGRTAGAPQRCIRSLGFGQPIRTINRTAYVFGQGDVIYVQRTTNPQDVDRRFALSIKRLETTSGVEICRTDPAESFDRALGVPRAAVIFTDFIPYTRTPRG